MKVSELRIGNYLLHKGETWQVNNIHGSSGLIHVLPKGSYGLNTRTIHDFVPIVLTQEWHNKFTNEYVWDEEEGLIYLEIGVIKMNAIKERLEFVHQWQNLYFALTGEELTPE